MDCTEVEVGAGDCTERRRCASVCALSGLSEPPDTLSDEWSCGCSGGAEGGVRTGGHCEWDAETDCAGVWGDEESELSGGGLWGCG